MPGRAAAPKVIRRIVQAANVMSSCDDLDEIHVAPMARMDRPGAPFHGTSIPETRPRFGADAPFGIPGLAFQGVPEPRFRGRESSGSRPTSASRTKFHRATEPKSFPVEGA